MTEEKKPTFEEQLNQLQQIVNHLEQGNVPLEEALNQYKNGIELARSLQQKLTNAEKTLGSLIDDDGNEKQYEKSTDDPSNNGGGNRGYGSDEKPLEE
ncbi:exodeoxyribonuclease VII small subunit [Limosilactobacillus sp.]|jgi:exodeoxyribonuclease VII small subunit|uniref:exodeoxyribonuclease VII small subunit n=1 Tax=Limosilactobacillus sp. TaxID=2773925 RepID=UPI0025BF70B4|nr:exodeoxyribonuclease VII small subunit [Limosilactobacillus sp.]MCI2031400.1 exodeoxyribonuclease VII small subunit [Limosilactobacillus sp.]